MMMMTTTMTTTMTMIMMIACDGLRKWFPTLSHALSPKTWFIPSWLIPIHKMMDPLLTPQPYPKL